MLYRWAILLPILGACGSDHCEFLTVDDPVRIERDTPTEVQVAVGALPADLHYTPLLTMTGYGASGGLTHWLVARDGSQGMHCDSEPRNSDRSYMRQVDLAPHSSFSVWLEGAIAGQYTLELALFDYQSARSLFGEPVCTKNSSST